MEEYLKPLPENISLQIFSGDELIFQSSGKWLYPLFEFEDFLKTYSGSCEDLRSHDSAIGKAAAALSIRLGIRRINADLLSGCAKEFIERWNLNAASEKSRLSPVVLSNKTLIPSLMCKTEEILAEKSDLEEIYTILKKRAGLL